MSPRKQVVDEGSGDDHPNSDAPIPANVIVVLSDVFPANVVVALSGVFTNKSVDTPGNERGVMEGEGGFNSLTPIRVRVGTKISCPVDFLR